MANIKSAKKRILVNKAKALQNQMLKSQLKTVIKKFNAAVEAGAEYAKGLGLLMNKSVIAAPHEELWEQI